MYLFNKIIFVLGFLGYTTGRFITSQNKKLEKIPNLTFAESQIVLSNPENEGAIMRSPVSMDIMR